MKNPRTSRGLIGWASLPQCRLNALESAFALRLLARQFARTADRFGLLARFFDGGFLEMLLELHFAEHAFALELFLEGT